MKGVSLLVAKQLELRVNIVTFSGVNKSQAPSNCTNLRPVSCCASQSAIFDMESTGNNVNIVTTTCPDRNHWADRGF